MRDMQARIRARSTTIHSFSSLSSTWASHVMGFSNPRRLHPTTLYPSPQYIDDLRKVSSPSGFSFLFAMRPAKGKAKAVNDPTERDPLLAASSPSHPHPPDRGILPQPSRLRSILVIILVITFSVILSFVLLIALLAASFRPSPSELSSLPSTAFKYAPPDSVTVLNVTDSGIWLNITVRCGIDADAALGVRGFTSAKEREFAEIHGERGIGSQWWESMRRWVAHRALDSLPQRSIRVSLPDPIHVFPRHFTSPPLLSLLVDQLDIPLVSGVPPVASPERPQWLQATSVIAFARPIASTGELWAFVQRSWIEGSVQVVVSTPLALARVPQSPWWAQFAQVNESDLIMELALPGESDLVR
jgi:hypothetical protein